MLLFWIFTFTARSRILAMASREPLVVWHLLSEVYSPLKNPLNWHWTSAKSIQKEHISIGLQEVTTSSPCIPDLMRCQTKGLKGRKLFMNPSSNEFHQTSPRLNVRQFELRGSNMAKEFWMNVPGNTEAVSVGIRSCIQGQDVSNTAPVMPMPPSQPSHLPISSFKRLRPPRPDKTDFPKGMAYTAKCEVRANLIRYDKVSGWKDWRIFWRYSLLSRNDWRWEQNTTCTPFSIESKQTHV